MKNENSFNIVINLVIVLGRLSLTGKGYVFYDEAFVWNVASFDNDIGDIIFGVKNANSNAN